MSSASGYNSTHASVGPVKYPQSVPRTRASRESVAQMGKRHSLRLSEGFENNKDGCVSAIVRNRSRTKGNTTRFESTTSRIELQRTSSATSIESTEDYVFLASSSPPNYSLSFKSCEPHGSSSFGPSFDPRSDVSIINSSTPAPSSSPPPPTSPLASFSCRSSDPLSSPAEPLPLPDYFQTPRRSSRRLVKKPAPDVEDEKTDVRSEDGPQICSGDEELSLNALPSNVTTSNSPSARQARDVSPPLLKGELDRLKYLLKEEAQAKEADRPTWLVRSKREGPAGKGVDVRFTEGGKGRCIDLWEMKSPGKVHDEDQKETEKTSFYGLTDDKEEDRLGSRTSSPTYPSSECSSVISSLLSSASPSPSRSCSSSRSYSPFTNRMPRTVSAPALLLLSTGKASLSTAQILSTDMDWLVPSSARQRATRSFSSSLPTYQSTFQTSAVPWSSLSLLPFCSNQHLVVQPTSASKKKSDETRRNRLAAFEKRNTPDVTKYVSTGSLSGDDTSSSALQVVQMTGVGRIAVSIETFKTMLKDGSVDTDEPQDDLESSKPGNITSIALPKHSISKPDWPETSYPWSISTMEASRIGAERRKVVLEAVGRYLDGDDTWDDLDLNDQGRLTDHPLSRNWSASSSSQESGRNTHHGGISSGSGGKTGYELRKEVAKRPKVRYGLSRPMLGLNGKQFDPADARQALLLRNQARGSLSCVQLEKNEPGKEVLADEEDILGCFCQCEMEDEAVVNCDSCQTWHHMSCIGLMPDDLDEEWFCWKCEPSEDSLSSSIIDSSPVICSPIRPTSLSLSSQTSSFFSSPPSSPLLRSDSQSAASRTSCRTSDISLDDRYGKSWDFFQATPPTTDVDEDSSEEDQEDDDDDDEEEDPDYSDEDSFDPSSTPSKHLSSEDLLFGSTPLSTDRTSSVSSTSFILCTTPSHPSPYSSPPPRSPTSTAIYKLRTTMNARSIPPGLEFDICPSSADSEGPLSPYKPGWEESSSPLMRARLMPGSCSKMTNEQESGLGMGLIGTRLGDARW